MDGFASCVLTFNLKGEFLAVRRSDNGKYGLPGGKREVGESDVECAIREVKEETGIDVSDLVEVYRTVDKYGHLVPCYFADKNSGELVSSDEGSAEWVTLNAFFADNAFPEYNIEAYTSWIRYILTKSWNAAMAE